MAMTKLSDYFDYKIDADGNQYMSVSVSGMTLLRLPPTNKCSAFVQTERLELGLEGLLPPHATNLETQIARPYANYKKLTDYLAKYQFLRAVQDDL